VIEEMMTATEPLVAGNGLADFLFWSVTNSTAGSFVYPAHERMVDPHFPPGDDAATLTAWYIGRGGNGPGRPALIFDAFGEDIGDWLDWGDPFDPFTVDPAARRGVGDDDDVASTDLSAVTLTAANPWPGDPLLVFDRWLVIGDGVPPLSNELTEAQGWTGYAFALYKRAKSTATFEPVRPVLGFALDDSGVIHVPVSHGHLVPGPGPGGPFGLALARALAMYELASDTPDASSRAALQQAVLRYVDDQTQGAIKATGAQLAGE
jgi:hypothetical protein